MIRARTGLLSAVLLGSWGTAGAQDFTSTHTDCGGLQLYAAAGIPDAEAHKYQFHGICRELELNDDNHVVRVRWEGWVEVESRYDVKTAELDEAVKVTMSGQYDGPASGKVTLRLKCPQDPMLPPPGGGAPVGCTIMQSATTTTWPDFVLAWKKGAPFTKGKVALAQAVALSQQAGSKVPPPPPPPAKSKQPTRASIPATTAGPNSRIRARPTLPPRVPAPPPELTELVLDAKAKIPLQTGRSLVAQPLDGSLRWTILGSGGEVMRTFPQGSRAYRNSRQEILVNWGGGTFNAGPAQADRRLRLPR